MLGSALCGVAACSGSSRKDGSEGSLFAWCHWSSVQSLHASPSQYLNRASSCGSGYQPSDGVPCGSAAGSGSSRPRSRLAASTAAVRSSSRRFVWARSCCSFSRRRRSASRSCSALSARLVASSSCPASSSPACRAASGHLQSGPQRLRTAARGPPRFPWFRAARRPSRPDRAQLVPADPAPPPGPAAAGRIEAGSSPRPHMRRHCPQVPGWGPAPESEPRAQAPPGVPHSGLHDV